MDFDDSSLGCLRDEHGVSAQVALLPNVPTTPGETITYEGSEMHWEPHGWEGWSDLCAWQPMLPPADAYHVIVEGGGDGEVRAVQAAVEAATQTSWPATGAAGRPLLSVEPVMHEPTRASVEALARLTAHADVCSPDLRTAMRMARAAAANPGAEPAKLTRTRRQLGWVARGCARALRMRPSATLAIRDGEHGSYLLSDGRLRHAPPVPIAAVDPTGAGNAYAGALCALLASGAEADEAAGAASAVGAAFCATEGWPDASTAAWVSGRAAEARDRREREAQVRAFARTANIYLG